MTTTTDTLSCSVAISELKSRQQGTTKETERQQPRAPFQVGEEQHKQRPQGNYIENKMK